MQWPPPESDPRICATAS